MLETLIAYRYLALIPLAFIEGPAVSVIAGYLSRIGQFEVLLAIAALVFADILCDLFYFSLGRFSAKNERIRRFFEKRLEGKEKVFEDLWDKHFLTTMFFGKLAYAISVPIVMSAGARGIRLGKFFSYSIPISFIQSSLLVAIGYVLGEAYYLAFDYVKYPAIVAAVLIVVVLVGVYYAKAKSERVLVK